MLIFYREMVTNGDTEQVMPIVQELAALGKKHGVPLNIWSGSNGHVFGTMGVSVRYESLALAQRPVQSCTPTNNSLLRLDACKR